MLTIVVYVLLFVQSSVLTIDVYDAENVEGFDKFVKLQSSSESKANLKDVKCYINEEDIRKHEKLQLYDEKAKGLTSIKLKSMDSFLPAGKGDFEKEFKILKKIDSIKPPISPKVYFCVKDKKKNLCSSGAHDPNLIN